MKKSEKKNNIIKEEVAKSSSVWHMVIRVWISCRTKYPPTDQEGEKVSIQKYRHPKSALDRFVGMSTVKEVALNTLHILRSSLPMCEVPLQWFPG
jgi:hypothetical protein